MQIRNQMMKNNEVLASLNDCKYTPIISKIKVYLTNMTRS